MGEGALGEISLESVGWCWLVHVGLTFGCMVHGAERRESACTRHVRCVVGGGVSSAACREDGVAMSRFNVSRDARNDAQLHFCTLHSRFVMDDGLSSQLTIPHALSATIHRHPLTTQHGLAHHAMPLEWQTLYAHVRCLRPSGFRVRVAPAFTHKGPHLHCRPIVRQFSDHPRMLGQNITD